MTILKNVLENFYTPLEFSFLVEGYIRRFSFFRSHALLCLSL